MGILQSLLGFSPETLDLLFSRKRNPSLRGVVFFSLLGVGGGSSLRVSVPAAPGFICWGRSTLIPENQVPAGELGVVCSWEWLWAGKEESPGGIWAPCGQSRR